MKKLAFVLLSYLLIFAACRKNALIDKYDFSITVKTSIHGVTMDENENPIANAIVDIYGNKQLTDKNGFFLFRDIAVPRNNAYIKVEKDGYFHASKTLIVEAGTMNPVQIMLLDAKPSKFINAATGGTADYGDFSITLPAGGISIGTSTGDDYNATVNIAAKWLDPTSEHFVLQSPGRLVGRDNEGNITGMISTGMLAVELMTYAGQKLQIKEGFQADIRIRVPNGINNAPNTIPLWYFDEAEGIWIEEGFAILVNGFYVGKVAHFSFWNTDYKAPLAEVTFKVRNADGNPVSSARVHTSFGGRNGYGLTNTEGYIVGLVPANEVLESNVFVENNCIMP